MILKTACHDIYREDHLMAGDSEARSISAGRLRQICSDEYINLTKTSDRQTSSPDLSLLSEVLAVVAD